jgi:hypothetical protein
MNAKAVVTIALLLFVAISLVGMVVKDRTDMPAIGSDQSASTTAAPKLPRDGVAAFYFHGNNRCPTCRKIEATAAEAIAAGFAEESENRTVTWQVVNCESPANRHYIDDFELVAPTVVVVKTKEGKQVAWKNLMRVWELVGDSEAFSTYVQEEVRSYLTEGPAE